MKEALKELVGRTLQGFDVSVGEQFLRVRTAEGDLFYEVDGDCCSESWFAEIIGGMGILGQQVVDVREVDLPGPQDEHTRQEVDAAYGFEIRTWGGMATVVFRNSSNGYYGGWMRSSLGPRRAVEWRTVAVDDWTAWGAGEGGE